MKAIRRQQTMDVKKTCEENGYYDSLRGKPVSEACKEGSRRLRASGFCPMRALKKKNPRRFKAVIRRRAEARKELWRKERIWAGAQNQITSVTATNHLFCRIIQVLDDS